jgi:glutaredoxin
VTLYTRAGCGLCAPVEALLARLAGELGFAFEAVDIDGDDALLRRYMLEIPVVLVDGVEMRGGSLTPASVEVRIRDMLEDE